MDKYFKLLAEAFAIIWSVKHFLAVAQKVALCYSETVGENGKTAPDFPEPFYVIYF